MNSPIQFVQTSDGIAIAYCQHGEGPPLVYVRGWVGHLERMWALRDFRAFIEALGSRFQVTRFDTRGNGLSDQDVPAPTLDDLVLDIEAVTDRLGLSSFVLYGSTFGGLIAIAYAARHPDRVARLIVENVYSRGSDLGTREQRDALIAVIRALPRQASTQMLSILSDPARRGGSTESIQQSISDRGIVDLYTLAYEVDLVPDLARITAPTLIMHSRLSPTIPFDLGRRLAAQIADSRFVAVDSTSLNPYEGNASTVLKAVGEFLDVDLLSAYTPPSKATRPGPLTILFTDMEGSTQMTSRMGDAAAQAVLREHDAIIRECLQSHSGREIKHMGDGVMASFQSASDALSCAIEIQRAFAAHNKRADGDPINVRVALNAGEPLAEGEDIYGTSVQVAARILDKTEPGAVVVANVVRELVAGKGFRFKPRGTEQLRGIDEPVILYEVEWQEPEI